MQGWYALYIREMLIFKKRLCRLGYVLSVMITPIIYLLTFGLGLGRGMGYGGYIDFLLPGLIMMSGMTNSYTWVCNSINVGRLVNKNFQMHIMSPVTAKAMSFAYILSGITRGLFGILLILFAGISFVDKTIISAPFIIAIILNLILFSALGTVVGICVKSHEDVSTWNNFIITPMAFFSGTFFSIEHYPYLIKAVICLLPLTHVNLLAREDVWSDQALISLCVLAVYCAALIFMAGRLIKNYSE
ncbi:ABC transporter permease [Campylobacter sp.]|uniref:ABC transporter permease n=1 Tax=Campylobacter sp. TaxID=205 RepID=UPI0026FA88B9|nr:ABC transporter permease [Campylobacter sp.]